MGYSKDVNGNTFSVFCSGQLHKGHELAEVQGAFAQVFNITLEQASTIVGTKRVLKKNLSEQQARAYKQKLEGLGLVVGLRREAASKPSQASLSGLSLLPKGDEKDLENDAAVAPANSKQVFACPKCGTEQAKAPQCSHCGIYVDKYQKRLQSTPVVQGATRAEMATEESADESTHEVAAPAELLKPLSLAAAAAAAIIGALIWKFVALAFNYELGLIAWAIGGMIGFAVAATGSRGEKAGMICGALALVAIIGGKYMVVDSLKDDMMASLTEGFAELDLGALIEEQVRAAQYYVDEVDTEAELRQFMVDQGYSEADNPDAVSEEEIEIFEEYVAPELIGMTEGISEEDLSSGLAEQVNQISTFLLMKESIGFIDIVFLLLGVATAFRLGRGTAAV